ncbi:unnamed protein product [Durusdinium trenchii]|uniref:Palmitoyltransferase n=1 Tax=Durusdinium trenchii TaxID=1381693 RepID=A0ABP0L677_9DINO
MAPLGLVAEPDEDLVEVCVVALSGQDIIKFKVPRNTHAEDLYDMAGGSFASGICFKLSFQDQVLERNVDQPFRTATSPAVLNFTAGWHSRASAKSLLVDGGGLINLVRRGRHKLAHGILVNSSEDLMKPELLSWVAYTSGGAGPGTRPNGCPAPGALRLLWHVIKQRPGQARCRDPDTGKLPLHDAAWGHAPPEVAILLAACFPAGLKDRRNRSLESPEDLGRYVHSNFSWPSTDQLEGFDHHCRYLNVCVGGRTYPAWYTFVLLLFLLVVMCAVGCVQVLNEPFRHNLHEEYPTVFYVLLGTAAVASVIESLFLLALLAQHSYFCLAGITTLEYIKDQAPPFPSLPPRGWREVLYCSVCQGDLAKAAVNFWQCDVCDNSAVCPICYRAATSSATVTTYRASAMKRRSQALMGILDTSRHGGGSSKNRTPSIHSRLSSFSGEQREVRMGRKSVGAVVAAVEGHAGESRPSFVSGCCGRREEESETESSSEGG